MLKSILQQTGSQWRDIKICALFLVLCKASSVKLAWTCCLPLGYFSHFQMILLLAQNVALFCSHWPAGEDAGSGWRREAHSWAGPGASVLRPPEGPRRPPRADAVRRQPRQRHTHPGGVETWARHSRQALLTGFSATMYRCLREQMRGSFICPLMLVMIQFTVCLNYCWSCGENKWLSPFPPQGYASERWRASCRSHGETPRGKTPWQCLPDQTMPSTYWCHNLQNIQPMVPLYILTLDFSWTCLTIESETQNWHTFVFLLLFFL